jgi:hypothetical protein
MVKDFSKVNVSKESIIIDEKDKRCAPSKQFDGTSCITLNYLISMAEAYNETEKNKIELYKNMETLNPEKYKIYLLNEFSTKITKCKNQRCWMDQPFMAKLATNEETGNIFRPKGPKGKFEWLNTFNILDNLTQYEAVHKNFKFLGAVPIDFDELPGLGIKNLDMDKLYADGIRKIGIVFNLDEHDKGGSHWVAGFCDIDKKGVYFFDSYGIPPEKRIQKLLRRFAEYIKKKFNLKENQITVDYNKNRHQFKNSECGVYSINFVEQMIKQSFKDVTNNIIDDDTINKKRATYFT